MTTIETSEGRHYLPTNEPRIYVYVAISGEFRLGTLVYVTKDSWIGVRLMGETRVDEYQPCQLTRIK